MPKPDRVSRRSALKLGVASAALPLVHIRTGRAAGRLSVGFWDHWVPAGNAVLKQQCDAWAAKNQVDLNVDFITSVGNKLVLTQAAEATRCTFRNGRQREQVEPRCAAAVAYDLPPYAGMLDFKVWDEVEGFVR